MCIENSEGNSGIHPGVLQSFSDRTGTMLETTALVVYFVHTNLLNLSASGGRLLIGNEYTLMGFLSASCNVEEVQGG